MFCDRNVETHLLLRDPWIVLNIPQKHHTLPADVLPSASEDLFIVLCGYYGGYLGNYCLCEFTSDVFFIVTSVLLVCTTVWIIWHHDLVVFDLTNNILPLLFFLTAIDRGSMLSDAQRYLMDNSALLILKFGR